MPSASSPIGAEARSILAAHGKEDFLARIEPHLRRLVAAVDEDALDIFDSSFEGEAHAVAQRLGSMHPAGHALSEGDYQAAGIRAGIVTHIVAFLVNVAATVAVDYAKAVAPNYVPGASPQTAASISASDLIAEQLKKTNQ